MNNSGQNDQFTYLSPDILQRQQKFKACMPCWAMHMLPRVHAVLIHNVLVEASNYSILHYTIIRLAEVHRWMKYMKMISEL